MKTASYRLFGILARVCAIAAALVSLNGRLCAQATTGTIEGRIFDPRRGEYVENARITIEGTKQEVFSDPTGVYRLVNVPAGAATLTIFYTGRGTQTEQVV